MQHFFSWNPHTIHPTARNCYYKGMGCVLGVQSLIYDLPLLLCKQYPGIHDDFIKWKHFPHYWPFVREIHQSPVNSHHEGQWRGSFDVFFAIRLNIQLSNRSWGWWFEMPSCSLYDITVMIDHVITRPICIILKFQFYQHKLWEFTFKCKQIVGDMARFKLNSYKCYCFLHVRSEMYIHFQPHVRKTIAFCVNKLQPDTKLCYFA